MFEGGSHLSAMTRKSTYFFAVDLPVEHVRRLEGALYQLDDMCLANNRARLEALWEPRSNYHATVLFLGKPDVYPQWKVSMAKAVLQEFEPFEMQLTENIDMFGQEPDVAVVRMLDGGVCKRMKRALSSCFLAGQVGQADEPTAQRDKTHTLKAGGWGRTVEPHITVARNCLQWNSNLLVIKPPSEPFTIDSVKLYRGLTVRGSRVYEVLEDIALKVV
jgi:2'-5' RNA ligase